MRNKAILSLLAMALLAACDRSGSGQHAGGEPAATAAKADAGMPDTAPSARERELAPKARRHAQASQEARTAADEARAAATRAEQATAAAARHQAVLDQEAAASTASDAPAAAALTTFLTPTDGALDCASPARDAVVQHHTRDASAAIPRHWDMGDDYSREVDAVMAAPGSYELLSRTNKAPQELLFDCAKAVDPKRFVGVAMAMADAACPAVADAVPLAEARLPETGEPLRQFDGDAMQASLATACSDLEKILPAHPLVAEAAAAPRLYAAAWSATRAAVRDGRVAMNAQLAAAAAAANSAALAATSRSEALQAEVASLADAHRQHGLEVEARQQRLAQAEQIRARQAAEALFAQARRDAEAREQREQAWRDAGNAGLSPEGMRECRTTHGTTMMALVNASTAVGMTQGPQAAAEWVIENARERGLSDECIQVLSRN